MFLKNVKKKPYINVTNKNVTRKPRFMSQESRLSLCYQNVSFWSYVASNNESICWNESLTLLILIVGVNVLDLEIWL